MVMIVEDLKVVNIDVFIVVGGVVLMRKFIDNWILLLYKGFVCYVSDVMMGFDIINKF